MSRLVDLADRHDQFKVTCLVLVALTALSLLTLATFGDGTMTPLSLK